MRVQVYYLDQGVYRKAYITEITKDQFEKSKNDTFWVAAEFKNNVYGDTLPNLLKSDEFTNINGTRLIKIKSRPGVGSTEGGKEKHLNYSIADF